jgi:hypothetical protein
VRQRGGWEFLETRGNPWFCLGLWFGLVGEK